MRDCPICKSEHREDIERVLFTVEPNEAATDTLEKIAREYDVTVEDLQRHDLFHSPLGSPTSDSIVRQIKMRETDMLAAVSEDYAMTIQIVGKRIRKRAGDNGVEFERSLTKPMVELYTGCGSELRNNVKAIADINNLLNGPKDDGLGGLRALAEALRFSKERDADEE